MDEVEQPIEVQAGLEIVAQEGSNNGKAPATGPSTGEVQATASTICMPCLIARVVLLAAAGALLIAIVIQEQKKAASSASG